MQETKKKKRAVALFVIVLICLCGWWAVRKEGFFLDEIYSYGLANSSYVPFLSWLHGGEQVANGKLPEAVFTQSEFLNYVAPQGSTRFDYASVYYNQTQDVHPPLFYFLLHTVCSLFPGSFTKWTGLGMNFVLLGGTLAALYALGMELFADWKKALFVCALYAFNREMISNVTMVRMYMLMTLLTILLALLVAKSLRRPSVPKYLLIGVTIYLGMMTQYFFVVYAFLLCAAYDLYLMFRREWKNATTFSLSALAGVGGMLLTFPCWYAQLHSQDTVSLESTANNLLDLAQYPKGPLELIGWSIVGFAVGAGIMAVLILTKLGQRWLPGKLRGTTLIPGGVKLITVPALAAFLVIAVISPYKSLRYVYHLQPLEALFCGCGLFSILDTLRAGTRKRVLQIVCLAMVVLAFVIEPERMYSGTYKIDKELEQYSQAACVDITGDLGSFTSGVQELLKFQEVCVVPDDSSELLVQYNTGENDTLVLFIGGRGLWQFVTAEQVEQITAQNMETAWNVARQGDYEDVSLLATQEFEQIFVLKK